jgi:hypothetical protein
MTRLVDTSIRVLSQEPLAGAIPTATLLELAEVLDGAGFAYPEVSGGGVFDSAVRQGVESPWERIRSLKARTTTPLALAVRGRFLVGSRPVGDDLIRRFMSSAAATDRRLPAARSAERRGQPPRRGPGDRGRRLRVRCGPQWSSRHEALIGLRGGCRASAPRGSCFTTLRGSSSPTAQASSSPSCATDQSSRRPRPGRGATGSRWLRGHGQAQT